MSVLCAFTPHTHIHTNVVTYSAYQLETVYLVRTIHILWYYHTVSHSITQAQHSSIIRKYLFIGSSVSASTSKRTLVYGLHK